MKVVIPLTYSGTVGIYSHLLVELFPIGSVISDTIVASE